MLDKAIGLAQAQRIRSGQLAEALVWSGLMGLRVLLPANNAEYIERLTRGEDLARSLGDSPIILRALHCRISVSAITGEFNRAALAVDEGLALARHLGAPGWIIRFELVAARFANAVGDEEQALRLSLSAPATAKRGRDTRAILEAAVLLQLWIPGSAAASAAVPSPSELIAMAGAIRQTAIQTVLLPSFALQALAAGDSAAAADWCAQGLELSGSTSMAIATAGVAASRLRPPLGSPGPIPAIR